MTTLLQEKVEKQLRTVIKSYCQRFAWSPQELSTNAGFHRDTVPHVLAGRRPMTHQVIEKIARAFGTNAARLIREAEEQLDKAAGNSV